MTYAAVFFDLFDTLVRFDRDRLPEIEVDGRAVRSTAGELWALLRSHAPSVSLRRCYWALVASWQEAERLRGIDHREIPARARFSDFFQRLGLDEASLPAGLAEALLEAHRRELSRAATFPAHHRGVLERLARRHPLAVVSNFDYTPTALGILEAGGVRGLFAAIVVSDAVGWRKPRPDIYRAALEAVGVEPARTLFVGDRLDIDVAGAHGVGMPAAWINPSGEAAPAGLAAPEFEIRDLGEVEGIVASGGRSAAS
jgi:putative hydrolase of the HAD superfamily